MLQLVALIQIQMKYPVQFQLLSQNVQIIGVSYAGSKNFKMALFNGNFFTSKLDSVNYLVVVDVQNEQKVVFQTGEGNVRPIETVGFHVLLDDTHLLGRLDVHFFVDDGGAGVYDNWFHCEFHFVVNCVIIL